MEKKRLTVHSNLRVVCRDVKEEWDHIYWNTIVCMAQGDKRCVLDELKYEWMEYGGWRIR